MLIQLCRTTINVLVKKSKIQNISFLCKVMYWFEMNLMVWLNSRYFISFITKYNFRPWSYIWRRWRKITINNEMTSNKTNFNKKKKCFSVEAISIQIKLSKNSARTVAECILLGTSIHLFVLSLWLSKCFCLNYWFNFTKKCFSSLQCPIILTKNTSTCLIYFMGKFELEFCFLFQSKID